MCSESLNASPACPNVTVFMLPPKVCRCLKNKNDKSQLNWGPKSDLQRKGPLQLK